MDALASASRLFKIVYRGDRPPKDVCAAVRKPQNLNSTLNSVFPIPKGYGNIPSDAVPTLTLLAFYGYGGNSEEWQQRTVQGG